jgi:hypothetical protein
VSSTGNGAGHCRVTPLKDYQQGINLQILERLDGEGRRLPYLDEGIPLPHAYTQTR